MIFIIQSLLKKKGMRLRQLKGEPNQNILQSHKKENIAGSN